MIERNELEAALEAILFVSSEPVSRERLLGIFPERQREEAQEALAAVLERHQPAEGRGVMMDEVAGGVRLVTPPEVNDWLRRFFEVTGAKKLSMGALETLAIIAYRQPITGPEIQELRSVNPSGVLKTLLEKRMIRIQGRKEVVGKPFLYATTREFLVHFGLRSVKDLPPLEEFEEALAEGDGLAETLPGIDLEEAVLRQAAEIEEDEGPAADAEGEPDEPEEEADAPRAEGEAEAAAGTEAGEEGDDEAAVSEEPEGLEPAAPQAEESADEGAEESAVAEAPEEPALPEPALPEPALPEPESLEPEPVAAEERR